MSAPDAVPDGDAIPHSDDTATNDAIPDGSDPAALARWLFDLARAGDGERLGAYVDAGAPVNMVNENGDTMVMLAAYHGHADAVRALTSRGADVNLPNDRGQTPVAGAVFKGESDVIAALMEAGADLDAGTPSARDTAAMFGTMHLLGEG